MSTSDYRSEIYAALDIATRLPAPTHWYDLLDKDLLEWEAMRRDEDEDMNAEEASK